MITLKKPRKTPDIQIGEIGVYLKVINQKYPDIKEPQDLALKVSSEFGVKCTKIDIVGYHQTYVQHEDYELESRRQENGIVM